MLILNLIAALTLGLVLWLYSVRAKNVNIVDVGWGVGFVLIAWLTWIQSWNQGHTPPPTKVDDSQSPSAYALILVLMVTLWGLRLSGYLLWRSWGKAEDYRYAAMRSRWGSQFPLRSLITVFGLQAVLIWFISLCVQLGIIGSPSQGGRLGTGIAIWVVGLLFESVGDWQLMRFKSDPNNRGKVMDRGLWRWTRHPNYFGDFLVWWGLYIAAAQSNSWWLTITGPALMSFLLIRVSGVKLLESSLTQRIDGYREYVQRTSSFVPWPPK